MKGPDDDDDDDAMVTTLVTKSMRSKMARFCGFSSWEHSGVMEAQAKIQLVSEPLH